MHLINQNPNEYNNYFNNYKLFILPYSSLDNSGVRQSLVSNEGLCALPHLGTLTALITLLPQLTALIIV